MENLGNIVPNNTESLEAEKIEQLHYDDLSPEQLKIVNDFYNSVIISRKKKITDIIDIPLELRSALAERFITGHHYSNGGENRISDADVLLENFGLFGRLDASVAISLLDHNFDTKILILIFDNLDKFDNIDYTKLAQVLSPDQIFGQPHEKILDKFPDHNRLIIDLWDFFEKMQRVPDCFITQIPNLRNIDINLLAPKFFDLFAKEKNETIILTALIKMIENHGKDVPVLILSYVLDVAKIFPKTLSYRYIWDKCQQELEEKENISLLEFEILMSAKDLVITDWLWQHQEKLKKIEPEKVAALFLPVFEGRKSLMLDILRWQDKEEYDQLEEERMAKGGSTAPRRRKRRVEYIDAFPSYGIETNNKLCEEIQFPADVEKVLANFPDLNEGKLLDNLLEKSPSFILHNQELFSNIDSEVKRKILDNLMQIGGGRQVIFKNFDFFKEFHNEELAFQLIANDDDSGVEFVLNNLGAFLDINHEKLIDHLLERKLDRLLDRYYQKLNLGLDQQSLDDVLKKNSLRFSEYFLIKDILESTELESEESARQIFLRLKEKSAYWRDEDNIIEPFEDGAQYFGYEKMWEYVSRPKLSRHDALHNFPNILNLAQASGLEAKQFFYQILSQVKKDEAVYYEGTSHHHLNMIANNISLDIAKVLAEAGNYQDIPAMQQALEGIEAPADVFSSWKSLKKYADIFQLLKRKEILNELVELKKTGQVELFNYVEKLAFHPNVDLKAVVQFWRQPDEFLEIEEIHAASSHERKKPSRYTNIPNLDLTAEDLRDALVEGHYDSMQAFQPLGIEYVVRDLSSGDLPQLIKQALGSRSQGILGQARDPKKLFAELNTILKKQGSNLNAYLQMDSEAEFQLDEKTEQDLVNKLFDQQIGLAVKTKKYRAQVHLKSDPEAVVAGNDTSCCMPFGSGKNNVYTFNPITSLFTVQVETEDGHWRTVAQSVLTRDKDIGVQVDELIDRLENEHTNMNEVIPEDILRKSQGIITCDNVEVAKNFVDVNFGPVIEDIYRDFFQEYTAHFAQTDDLDAQRVIIGPGYSDSLTHLPRTANHFVPEAPVGYSDNVQAESLVLNLKAQESLRLAHRAIHMQAKLKAEQFVDTMAQQAVLPKGVDYLTFRDSLSVAYIEGKAYHDNQTLMQYLHNMENALIAKDVSNTFKNRPNMSLQHRDAEGKTHAYILAYEGKKDKDGEDLLYVADLASDGHARAGASLVLGFVELYKKNYLAKDDLKPIYAQLREQTSYKLVMNQLDKISKSMGIKFEVEELSTYEMGDDTMHEVILRPVKI